VAAAFSLLASLAWGVGDFLGGVKSRTLPAMVVIAASQPFGLVAIAVVLAVRASGPPDAGIAWAVPSALLGTIGLFAFYRGMAAGTISVVAPIASVAAAIPVVWGIAQGDRVSPLQELGFAAALGGTAMISIERHAERRRLASGAAWGLVAMLGFGGYFVLLHDASHHDWLWPSFVFRLTSVTLIWSALLLTRQRPRGVRPHVPVLIAIGLLDTGGNALFAAASSSHGLLSVVSVLASLYPAVTVLLARLVLGERVQRSQDLGVVVTVTGVVLVSAG
jgi:drug/metabolite transporter (DMT)-like permease